MPDRIHYDLEDIEPEIREPTAAEKKRETHAVMSKHGVGDFEKIAMTETEDLAAPLHVDAKIRHDAGAELASYQDGYNNYTVPWRSTLRAMGRARDLGLTGAPVNPQMANAPTTPDQMSPRLAKRFRKLSLTHDQQALSAFASWSTAQSALQGDAEKVLSGQQILRGAMENYRSVQMMLSRRKLEARREGEIGQIAAIDHAAEVCANIVEVGAEAISGAAEIDEALEAHGAIEEGVEGEAEGGAAEDSSFDQWRSGGQKAGDAVASAGAAVDGGKAIAQQVQKYALAGQGLSLKDVFIVASGDTAKYDRLEKDIETLTAAISELQFDQEKEQVVAAQQLLDGFQLELKTRTKTVAMDRRNARRAAELFGASNAKSDKTGTEMMLAMYSAEAYQELDTFGTLADKERTQHVDPHLGNVMGYVDDKWAWFEGENVMESGVALRDNVVHVAQQQSYFAEHLPDWQTSAAAWRQFLEVRTQQSLVDDSE